MQVMVTFGALLSYCVGWPYAAERAAFIKIGGLDVPWWRVMLGLGLLPAIGQVRMLPFLHSCVDHKANPD